MLKWNMTENSDLMTSNLMTSRNFFEEGNCDSIWLTVFPQFHLLHELTIKVAEKTYKFWDPPDFIPKQLILQA